MGSGEVAERMEVVAVHLHAMLQGVRVLLWLP